MAELRTITIHHTVTAPDISLEGLLRIAWSRGFRTHGYAYYVQYIRGEVLIHQGRPENGDRWITEREQGAHSLGENATSIGVALVGDYEEHPVPQPLWEAAVRLVGVRCFYSFLHPSEAVKGHREMPGAATLCPGRYVDMDRFRLEAAAVKDSLTHMHALVG